MTCPECGSENVDRDEVDIGVGVQCGPYGCYDCGWTEWHWSQDFPDTDDGE